MFNKIKENAWAEYHNKNGKTFLRSNDNLKWREVKLFTNWSGYVEIITVTSYLQYKSSNNH